MDDSGSLPDSGSDRIIERGKTYDHEEHRFVKVIGIWKGVERVDSARNTNQKEIIIVRYSAELDGDQAGELTDTIDEFLIAIDGRSVD